ncbi:hypothetical protein [Streptomyces sp. NPDC101149]|uniref:hypothetical protein n=1 Tax=Streptomyces sp. NPDC101149 TaxID=3366113 RepID=UPI00381B1668
MSQQYPPNPQQPQQPGYGYPQQPGPAQPGWGAPGPQQPWGMPPQPPKKGGAGKAFGIGCLSIIGLFVVIGIIAAIAGGGSSDDKKSTSSKPAASAPQEQQPAAEDTPSEKPKAEEPAKKPEKKPEPKPEKKVVTFKVWGNAPSGALGPLDITYGSDSDNRDGKWKNGTFTATLPYDDDAMYYTVMAQLQGSGDIQCSVTVDGHTEKGHASGGYNICHAQANSGLFGSWN